MLQAGGLRRDWVLIDVENRVGRPLPEGRDDGCRGRARSNGVVRWMRELRQCGVHHDCSVRRMERQRRPSLSGDTGDRHKHHGRRQEHFVHLPRRPRWYLCHQQQRPQADVVDGRHGPLGIGQPRQPVPGSSCSRLASPEECLPRHGDRELPGPNGQRHSEHSGRHLSHSFDLGGLFLLRRAPGHRLPQRGGHPDRSLCPPSHLAAAPGGQRHSDLYRRSGDRHHADGRRVARRDRTGQQGQRLQPRLGAAT